MSEDCFNRKCVECIDHAIVKGKIVCNKDNRLKLRKTAMEEFLEEQ